MILPIWEGTPHRQILDGVEVMERKQAHQMLFNHLSPFASPHALESVAAEVEGLLSLPEEKKEAQAEPVFNLLAKFTAETLRQRLSGSYGRQEAESNYKN
jgi:hypothetical protein